MTTRFTARLAAFCLSAVLTLAMLGSVNFLATAEPATTALLASAAPLLA
jgi:hypothetical protein